MYLRFELNIKYCIYLYYLRYTGVSEFRQKICNAFTMYRTTYLIVNKTNIRIVITLI